MREPFNIVTNLSARVVQLRQWYTSHRTQRRRRPEPVYLLSVHLLLATLTLISAENTSWCGMDLSQQISSADVVAKASVVSRSAVYEGRYMATLRIDKLLHRTSSQFKSKFLRLRLDSPNFQSKARCPIAAKVKPDTKYLLLLKRTGPDQAGLFAGKNEFEVVSPPLRATKKTLRDIRSILCPDCSSRKQTKQLKKRHSRNHGEEQEPKKKRKHQMRLTCSARGNPPPTLYWTMNKRVIKDSPRTRIHTKKISKYLRKSILKLQGPVNASIHVQCHAYNSYGHTSRVKLKTLQTTTTSTTTTTTTPSPVLYRRSNQQHSQFRRTKSISAFSGVNNPMYSTGCPLENYCMNGGICRYYSDIGELTCHCSRGFHGRRCERKYVSGSDLNGPKMSGAVPICLFGMGHYPCH